MKRTIFIMSALLGIGAMQETAAQSKRSILPDVSVENFSMSREGKYLNVAMDVDLSELDVNSNRAVLLTPRLVNGNDSLEFPSVGVYGRRRYYYYVRNGVSAITGETEKTYRAKDKPGQLAYDNSILFQDWMDGATLKFHRCDWGCCQDILAEYDGLLGTHREEFFPDLIFVQPKAEIEKIDSAERTAHIIFIVDRTEINYKRQQNVDELNRIRMTIDSIKNDPDYTVTSLTVRGYASPESPYSHNTDLANGRTRTLKEYISKYCGFPEGMISTSAEPEDWAGLERAVETSHIENRDAILELIRTDMDPDRKEALIKMRYPADYKFLLNTVYPGLRRSEYKVRYRIRKFTDVEEIKRIMATQPQKLSQNEFYLVAQEYEPGTQEFTDVFETAVRLFPNDPVANLNAASAAIRKDDFASARKYLEKAGDTAEAIYARGALAIREKDYDAARKYMESAKAKGLPQAKATLEKLDKRYR